MIESDTEILSNTKKSEDGANTKYKVLVPGHGLVEGTMEGRPSFNNNLQWCSYVRGEVYARQKREEAEAFSRRAALDVAAQQAVANTDGFGGRQASASGDIPESETSLEEIVKAKVASLRGHHATITAEIADATRKKRALEVELGLAEQLEKVYADSGRREDGEEAPSPQKGKRGPSKRPSSPKTGDAEPRPRSGRTSGKAGSKS